jgi:hypothetical protein
VLARRTMTRRRCSPQRAEVDSDERRVEEDRTLCERWLR